VSTPVARYALIARRAWTFSIVYWIVGVVLLSGIAVVLEVVEGTLVIFGAGCVVALLAYLVAFGIQWGRAGAAWFAEYFSSDIDAALEVLDVDFLAELAKATPRRPRQLSRALQARFPALAGTTATDKILAKLVRDPVLEPTAGSRTDAVIPRSDAGGLAEWAESKSFADLRRLRGLLSVLGYGLASAGVALFIVIALVTRSQVGGVACAVALPFLVAGIAALFIRNSTVTPALGVVHYREEFGSSASRFLEMSGVAAYAVPSVAAGAPILPAVTAIQRSYPSLPLWDAVAIARLAQGTSAAGAGDIR
jgi:hypothetical protein